MHQSYLGGAYTTFWVRLRFALYQPKIQVVEYFFDHIRILYKRNYSHFRRTFRTQKWINFVNFLYQSRPVFSESASTGHAQLPKQAPIDVKSRLGDGLPAKDRFGSFATGFPHAFLQLF